MFNCTELLQAIKLDESSAQEFIDVLTNAIEKMGTGYNTRTIDDGVEVYMVVSAGSGSKEITVKMYYYGSICVISAMEVNLPMSFTEDEFNEHFQCECGSPYCNVPDAQVKLSSSCSGNNCKCCSTTTSSNSSSSSSSSSSSADTSSNDTSTNTDTDTGDSSDTKDDGDTTTDTETDNSSTETDSGTSTETDINTDTGETTTETETDGGATESTT